MNNLSVLTNQSTIKSVELVEIINEFRAAEHNENILQHYDFVKKIKKELKTLELLGLGGDGNISESLYIDSQNKKQPCFELNRDGMLQMLNSESTYVRYKTIEYINKLEEKLKIPTTYKENVQPLNTSELSPELQMFNKMFQAVANVELSNKQLKEEITNTNEKIDGIKDIVALNSTDWKKDTSSLISKMALKLGGFEHISDLRKESYNLLNKRTGIKLETRLTNKRRRMADEGVCKSKRDKLNYIDVIAEDKKELEVYLAIVKEMAIKYGVA